MTALKLKKICYFTLSDSCPRLTSSVAVPPSSVTNEDVILSYSNFELSKLSTNAKQLFTLEVTSRKKSTSLSSIFSSQKNGLNGLTSLGNRY